MARSSQLRRFVSNRARHFAGLGLATATVMLSASCLITSDPEFSDPERTPPFLLVDRATPDPRSIVVIHPTEPSRTFSAFLRSEDAGDPVAVRLALDYGDAGIQGRPFQDSNNQPTVKPGHFTDADPRLVIATCSVDELFMDEGCHRLSLMVSHRFDDASGCPVDDGDYDVVTWTVIRCGATGCPVIDPIAGCPPVEKSCSDN